MCLFWDCNGTQDSTLLCRFIEFPGVSTRIQNHLKRALCYYGFKTLKLFNF